MWQHTLQVGHLVMVPTSNIYMYKYFTERYLSVFGIHMRLQHCGSPIIQTTFTNQTTPTYIQIILKEEEGKKKSAAMLNHIRFPRISVPHFFARSILNCSIDVSNI